MKAPQRTLAAVTAAAIVAATAAVAEEVHQRRSGDHAVAAPEEAPHSSSAAPRVPWLAALVALERGYQPGIEELRRLAVALADAPSEVFIAWDRQGRFLFYAVGNPHRVQIPRSLLPKLDGSVAIHNHLHRVSPSPRDLDTVLRYGLRRLHVVARIDGVVSLTDISRTEAVKGSRHGGGLPAGYLAWQPVAATAPPPVVEEPTVVAAQVSYRLLGAWL